MVLACSLAYYLVGSVCTIVAFTWILLHCSAYINLIDDIFKEIVPAWAHTVAINLPEMLCVGFDVQEMRLSIEGD